MTHTKPHHIIKYVSQKISHTIIFFDTYTTLPQQLFRENFFTNKNI